MVSAYERALGGRIGAWVDIGKMVDAVSSYQGRSYLPPLANWGARACSAMMASGGEWVHE
ncbi:hypothetical protein [Arthrobacter sp. HLT1-20]